MGPAPFPRAKKACTGLCLLCCRCLTADRYCRRNRYDLDPEGPGTCLFYVGVGVRFEALVLPSPAKRPRLFNRELCDHAYKPADRSGLHSYSMDAGPLQRLNIALVGRELAGGRKNVCR